jgi:dienelactone hydrolase
MNCCTIERAREIAAAAAAPATRSPIEVVEVPDANHGFALAAYPSYRPAEAAATFARALEHLRKFGAGAR